MVLRRPVAAAVDEGGDGEMRVHLRKTVQQVVAAQRMIEQQMVPLSNVAVVETSHLGGESISLVATGYFSQQLPPFALASSCVRSTSYWRLREIEV